MRSLYTYDIPGANPTIRYYDKSLIRHRHEEEIDRFANKQKRIIDWYHPLARHVEPVDKDSFPTNTTLFDPKLTRQMPHALSSSRTLPNVTGKVTELDVSMSKSSILTQSGRKSLDASNLDNSPYFPHKYRDYDREYPNKWTGKREWRDGSV